MILINYAVCTACSLFMRPKKLDINMKQLIINYIHYRKYRTTTAKPSEEFDDKNTYKYNTPIGSLLYGPGGDWTVYGFDEKILKHTLFPYLVQKGEVLSFMHFNKNVIEQLESSHSIVIDYNFCNEFNNEFVEL